jgi:hypothetical protein
MSIIEEIRKRPILKALRESDEESKKGKGNIDITISKIKRGGTTFGRTPDLRYSRLSGELKGTESFPLYVVIQVDRETLFRSENTYASDIDLLFFGENVENLKFNTEISAESYVEIYYVGEVNVESRYRFTGKTIDISITGGAK